MTHDVVIPVYSDDQHRSLSHLKATLDTLRETATFDRLILVDDCSPDEEMRSYLREESRAHPLSLIRREKRGWFTRAANTGLRASTSQRVILLNSDLLLYPGWPEEMEAVMEESGAGLVGSLYWRNHAPGKELVRWELTEDPEYATGHCWLIDRTCFDTVGYLDESRQDAIHINSDRYYCYALNRAGIRTALSYQSHVEHLGHKSWGADLGRVFGLRLEDVS